jgi:twinkle protein
VIVPYPVLENDVHELYEQGLPSGERTGWPSLDALYTVAPCQWTLITGIPGAGKSELLDAIMVNLADRYEWRFAVFSPENHPVQLHASKLMEKWIGKPFGAGPTERMTPGEVGSSLDFVTKHFTFLKFERPNLTDVLREAGDISYKPWRKMGIVIDPWNQIEHFRPSNMTEAEYLSQSLSQVIALVRECQIHLWMIAHPKVIQRDRDGKRPVPTPYDISGGAHWFNKADNILCVHRDAADESQMVQVHVQKIRFKHIGHVGVAEFRYDRVTGKYHEIIKAVEQRALYAE